MGIPTSLRDSELGRPRWKHIQLEQLEDYKYGRGGYQLLIYIKIPKRPPSLLCNLPGLPAVMGRLFMQTTRNCLPRGSSKMEIACVWPSNLVLEVSVL